MPRPRAVQRGRRGRIVEARILVRDQHRDRRADRLAHAHAGEEVDRVGLDLLPPAAAVPALAAAQLVVDELLVDGTPAGMPSTSVISALPCDSPAVR